MKADLSTCALSAMTRAKSADLHIAEIQALAARFSAGQIDQCMELTLQHDENPCIAERDVEKAMNVLAKAEFVKTRMEQGMTQQEAIRELGRRIRAVQGAGR